MSMSNMPETLLHACTRYVKRKKKIPLILNMFLDILIIVFLKLKLIKKIIMVSSL